MYHTQRPDSLSKAHFPCDFNSPTLQASLFEIYAGKLYDLLNKRKKIHALADAKDNVVISGLSERTVSDPDKYTLFQWSEMFPWGKKVVLSFFFLMEALFDVEYFFNYELGPTWVAPPRVDLFSGGIHFLNEGMLEGVYQPAWWISTPLLFVHPKISQNTCFDRNCQQFFCFPEIFPPHKPLWVLFVHDTSPFERPLWGKRSVKCAGFILGEGLVKVHPPSPNGRNNDEEWGKRERMT